MKKKNFLRGISAKLALLTLAISGALMTGCYKDDGLDANSPGGNGSQVLDDAVYTITGTVTDAETGENIQGNVTYTDGTSKSVAFNGTYTIKIAKFSEDVKTLDLEFKASDASYNGGKAIVRTVNMNRVEDGNAVVYPVNVVMKKSAKEMKERKYKLSFIYKNAFTREEIVPEISTKIRESMEIKAADESNVTNADKYPAGDYTIRTQAVDKAYKSSITLLSLPYVQSEEGEDINKTVEILINPVDPEKEDTYTTLAGVIVDKNGNSLLAETIELMKDGTTTIKTIQNSTNFMFTVNDKEKGDYTIKATVKGLDPVSSGVYSIPACGNQNITIVFTESVEVETYVIDYELTFVYKNALTGEAISEDIKHTSQPVVTNNIYKAGEYAITTEATSNFKSSVTHVTLEEVKSTDRNAKAHKVIVIALAPVDSKETFTTLSGAVVNENGQPVMAKSIELIKDNATIETITNSASFTFVINDQKAGTYQIKTTKETGKEVISGDYKVPGCGNQVITVVFESDKPVLKDVVYNLTFKAIDIETGVEIGGVAFDFDGNAGSTASLVKHGTHTLTATATGYYIGKVTVKLPEIKNETGLFDQTINVYLRKTPVKDDEPVKVILMGEIVDALGNMIVAQSIKLEGSNSAVYSTNHFSFEVEVPADAANDYKKQWVVTAKVSKVDQDGNSLAPIVMPTTFVYEKSKGTTVISKDISVPFESKDGIIVIDTTTTPPGDGEQGEVKPDVNETTGQVESTIETTMLGNGTPEDKTTIIIEAGTVLETEEGAPLTSPIILTRDMKEEMDPTNNIDPEYAQPAVLRSFYGNPEGAQFKGNPLKVKFEDSYDNELGNLQLEYKVAGVWGSDPKDAPVEIVGKEYVMSVSHFSQFRAAVKGSMDKGTTGKEKMGEPYTTEVNKMNNSDKDLDVTITFKNAPTGAIYQPSLEEAIAKEFKNVNAQKIVKSTIENIFTNRSIAISNDFKPEDQELIFQVKPYTLVKSIQVKPVYEITTYNFTLNNKTVEIVVKSVLKYDVSAESVEIGHGHSHGHGGDLNAGGGIIVNE